MRWRGSDGAASRIHSMFGEVRAIIATPSLRSACSGDGGERAGDCAVGAGQFVEDREMVVARQHRQPDRQAARLRRSGEFLRLAPKLRQFAASDEQFERRRAVAKVRKRAERSDLVRLEPELVVERAEEDRLEGRKFR
jgi:hypothetical protein